MPAVIYTVFEKLLLDLFLGKPGTVAPAQLYMGLMTGQGEIGATDGASPPSATGYARQMVTGTEASGVITFPAVIFPAFTAVPSPNGATSWFIADALTGGNTFFSGPLNPSAVSGTLPVAVTTVGRSLELPTAQANQLVAGDILALGSACGNNLAYIGVSSLGLVDGSNTVVNTVSNVPNYVAGTPFSRDGSVRTYTVGFVEVVNASIAAVQG